MVWCAEPALVPLGRQQRAGRGAMLAELQLCDCRLLPYLPLLAGCPWPSPPQT